MKFDLNKTEPSKSSIDKHNVTLRSIMKYALMKGYIELQQIPDIKNKKYKYRSDRGLFTFPEFKQLFHSCMEWIKEEKNQYIKDRKLVLLALLSFVYNSGVRPIAETKNLRWCDVLYVHEKGGYFQIHVSGKSKERQFIPDENIFPLIDTLKCRFDHLKNLSIKNNELISIKDKIFILEDGSEPKRLSDLFRRLLNRCNLRQDSNGNYRCMYSLRSSYATKMMKQTEIPRKILADNLGTSEGMLQKYYDKMKADEFASTFSHPKNNKITINSSGDIIIQNSILKKIKYEYPINTEFNVWVKGNKLTIAPKVTKLQSFK